MLRQEQASGARELHLVFQLPAAGSAEVCARGPGQQEPWCSDWVGQSPRSGFYDGFFEVDIPRDQVAAGLVSVRVRWRVSGGADEGVERLQMLVW